MEPDDRGHPRGYSPALGLDIVHETEELEFYNPVTGERLLDLTEAKTELSIEQAARAAAEAHVAELEAELRRLRGDAT